VSDTGVEDQVAVKANLRPDRNNFAPTSLVVSDTGVEDRARVKAEVRRERDNLGSIGAA
jgi:hypothetical protein